MLPEHLDGVVKALAQRLALHNLALRLCQLALQLLHLPKRARKAGSTEWQEGNAQSARAIVPCARYLHEMLSLATSPNTAQVAANMCSISSGQQPSLLRHFHVSWDDPSCAPSALCGCAQPTQPDPSL